MNWLITFVFLSIGINLTSQTIINGNFQSNDGWSNEIYLLAITDYQDVFAATNKYHIDTAIINTNGDFTFHLNNLPCSDCLYRIDIRPVNTNGPTIIIGTSRENHALFELKENQTISITGKTNQLTKSFKIHSNSESWSFSELRKLRDPIYQYTDQIAQHQFTGRENPDSLKSATTNKLIALLNKNNKHLLSTMNESTNIYDKIIGSMLYDYDMNLDNDIAVYESMSAQLKLHYPEHAYLTQYDKNIYDSKYVLPIGSPAPFLTLPDTSGNHTNLLDIGGNLILIDFWASWCAPCRHENRNIVNPLYQKYKDQGFTVYSVSLDVDRKNWLKAIKQDNMLWINVSDLLGNQSPVYNTFKIDSLPTTYLINKKDFTILAKNIRGQALMEFVNEFYADK